MDAPIYELLAMKVGVIQTDMDRNQRRAAYACDVTYGTAKEFGFDFLRDRCCCVSVQRENVDMFGAAGESHATSEGPCSANHTLRWWMKPIAY